MIKNKLNKRICFVIPGWVTKHTGGAELQCYLLSEEFIKRDWNVEVITSEGELIFNNYLNKEIKYIYYKNYKFNFVNFIFAFFKLFKSNSAYYYIRTDAKFLRGALVFFAKIRKIKIIYALAHDDDAKNLSYASQFKKSNKNILKKIIRIFDTYLTDFFINESIYKVDKIVAQSVQQKYILKKITGLDSKVIYNSFKYPYYQSIIKENIVIWVANMRPFKRPELYIKLARLFTNSNWKFIMIGKPSNDMQEIEKASKELSNFSYLGALGYEETNRWFAKSKILVNTSTIEGFSNTFLQAWFYKTIIVSLAVNPNNILIEKNIGFCAEDNFSNLQKIIRNLINDYDANAEKIINGERYLKENFDLKNNMNKLIEVIDEL